MPDSPDVLMIDACGPGYTKESVTREGIGGSELEVTQIAHALVRRGHRVAVANPTSAVSHQDGVTYVPLARMGEYLPKRALYFERMTNMKFHGGEPPAKGAIVVRATDVACDPYIVHRPLLESGRGSLVGVSKWQLEESGAERKGFWWARHRHVVAPILDPTPPAVRFSGRFIYASNPLKGLAPTLATWLRFKQKHTELRDARLVIMVPGYMDGKTQKPPVELTREMRAAEVSYFGAPNPAEYRRQIAMSEGLFFVNSMPETFGNVAAIAERAGVRTHILCLNGKGGLTEALVDSSLVTEDAELFEHQFVMRYGLIRAHALNPIVPDRSAEALVGTWEKLLGLSPSDAAKLEPAYVIQEIPDAEAQPAPELPDDDVWGGYVPDAVSVESTFPVEDILKNVEPMPERFGTWLALQRKALAAGGSEMGLALGLFFLTASTRAEVVVEIGRFRGFSTLALAAGLDFVHGVGWQEPRAAEQRPTIDYDKLLRSRKRPVLWSIDPYPMPEAKALLEEAGLGRYVEWVDAKSGDVRDSAPIDLLFIDGDHSFEGVKADIRKFVPKVKPGGYFVLHDYFGWWGPGGENGSPIKRAIDLLLGPEFERVLIDTGFASFVIFRKSADLPLVLDPVPARIDKRPTVGLVMIAKNEGHVLARALASAGLVGFDHMTVIVDAESTDATAEIARRMGAEVFVRKFPGSIAGARNDAIAIAEQRTDYLVFLDPDDELEGEVPPNVGDAEAYQFHIRDHGATYPRLQMFRSKRGFHYSGIRHETLMPPAGPTPIIRMQESLIYKRVGGGSWQDQRPPKEKFLIHARDLEKHVIDHPDDARNVFYLAQSYKDAGERDLARKWYERRVAMGGFAEEVYTSLMMLAQMDDHDGKDPTPAFLRAFEAAPHRAEPLYFAAIWLRDDKRRRFALAYALAKQAAQIPRPPPGSFFIDDTCYAYGAVCETAIAAFFAGNYAASLEAFLEAQRRNAQPVEFVVGNIAVCRRKIEEAKRASVSEGATP